MLKQQSILEVIVNDRIYQLSLPADSPLGEVHDVLYKMRGFVIDRLIAAQSADKLVEGPVEIKGD